jgi:hypothetical protein
MPAWIGVLLVAWFLTAGAKCCFGQETQFPESSMTREQWQQRVEDSRRRSQEFVTNARMQGTPPTPPDEREKEATDRAMNDPSLQQGDIVATGKGFVVFVGRDEMHKPDDFVSAHGPQPQH